MVYYVVCTDIDDPKSKSLIFPLDPMIYIISFFSTLVHDKIPEIMFKLNCIATSPETG